eukprot:scaffold144904_cov18-Tisochrysis_lutea.AAC.1
MAGTARHMYERNPLTTYLDIYQQTLKSSSHIPGRSSAWGRRQQCQERPVQGRSAFQEDT